MMGITTREKSDNLYDQLQERTLRRIQELCGEVWTDYNEHDPGITLADTLHYALYELSYLLDLPLESYLGIRERTSASYRRKGFLSAEELSAGSPVTAADYEKLILRSLPSVTGCYVSIEEGHFYRIVLQIVAGAEQQQIRAEVERLYHAHRNLCEDLADISFAEELPLSVQEDLSGVLFSLTSPLSPQESSYTLLPDSWYSVVYHLPDCYGVGERGVPGNATPEQRVAAKQLKAYMLIYDHLLADTMRQAGQMETLLDLSGATPLYDLPAVQAPSVDEIVDPEKAAGLTLHTETSFQVRKACFLDMLDSIYGEDTRNYYRKLVLPLQNQERIRLIEALPQLNCERFRAPDLFTIGSVSGFSRFLLALDGVSGSPSPVSDVLAGYSLRLLDDALFLFVTGNIFLSGSQIPESRKRWNLFPKKRFLLLQICIPNSPCVFIYSGIICFTKVF
ncbi:MAG: hypothetical protein LUE93_15155 [Bacteroides sp.]|nr:hypothetical protein [Bacteroides sp.]